MVARKYDAANLLCLLFTYISVSFIIVAMILYCALQRYEGETGLNIARESVHPNSDVRVLHFFARGPHQIASHKRGTSAETSYLLPSND